MIILSMLKKTINQKTNWNTENGANYADYH